MNSIPGASFCGFVKRNYVCNNPPTPPKNANALRFGVLGTAFIASQALILPAKSHADVVVAAIASRDEIKARAYAKKHDIEKIFYGQDAYQQLIDDQSIDVVYNPLPNALHFEWTMKAIAAGKHVLLEKPSADTKEEARMMFNFAEEKGVVLLEAVHYLFHPAIQRVKEIIASGELGRIKTIKSDLSITKGLMKHDDIRYKYELGGGGFMDGGGYVVSCARYLSSSNPTEVISAKPTSVYEPDPRIDDGITALLAFPGDVTAEVTCNLQHPPWGPFGLLPSLPELGVTTKCEGGEIRLNVFSVPHVFHTITVKPTGQPERFEKRYTHPDSTNDEEWWSTYRYQLEAFVNRVRGRIPQAWVSVEESLANIEWVEKIYVKSGLGIRPTSTYKHDAEKLVSDSLRA